MANYELNNTVACGIDKLYATAHPIYDSSRLGVDMRKTLLYNGVNVSNDSLTRTNRTLSLKQYELTNHLGNVLVTITDKKIPKRVGGSGPIDYFDPEIATISDYYAFGAPMPTRGWADPNLKYKYGFNGKEKDNEVNADGGNYDFGARIYDSRLGRWLSLDPLEKKYPMHTPYSFCANDPILFIDIDGKDWFVNTKTGVVIYVRDASKLTKEVFDKYKLGDNPNDYERLGPNDMFGKKLPDSYGYDMLLSPVKIVEDSKMFMHKQGYSLVESIKIEETEKTLSEGKGAGTFDYTTGTITQIGDSKLTYVKKTEVNKKKIISNKETNPTVWESQKKIVYNLNKPIGQDIKDTAIYGSNQKSMSKSTGGLIATVLEVLIDLFKK